MCGAITKNVRKPQDVPHLTAWELRSIAQLLVCAAEALTEGRHAEETAKAVADARQRINAVDALVNADAPTKPAEKI